MILVASITGNDLYCAKFSTILGAKTLILMPKLRKVVTQNKMICGMKWCFGWHKKRATTCIFRYLWNDVEENLNPTIFDVIDLTVIFCEVEHAWNLQAPQLNVWL